MTIGREEDAGLHGRPNSNGYARKIMRLRADVPEGYLRVFLNTVAAAFVTNGDETLFAENSQVQTVDLKWVSQDPTTVRDRLFPKLH